MECARAFGALVTLRDSPEQEIPEELPRETYHEKAYAESAAEFTRLSNLTPEERASLGISLKADAVANAEKNLAEERTDLEKISMVLEQAKAWDAPPNHTKLKEFMIEQLTTSMPNVAYYEDLLTQCQNTTPDQFFEKHVGEAEWSVNYHANGQKEDDLRRDDRNTWIRELRESLAGV